MEIQAFPMGTSPKVNVIVRLFFELASYKIGAKHLSLCIKDSLGGHQSWIYFTLIQKYWFIGKLFRHLFIRTVLVLNIFLKFVGLYYNMSTLLGLFNVDVSLFCKYSYVSLILTAYQPFLGYSMLTLVSSASIRMCHWF